MALWDKEDSAAGVPNYWSNTQYNDAFLVDNEEAGVSSNRAKGLKTSGWNTYSTYTDSNGDVRHRVETLVAMNTPQSVEVGDDGASGNTTIEDATVADS